MIKLLSPFDLGNMAGLGIDKKSGSWDSAGQVQAVFERDERIDVTMNHQSRRRDLMQPFRNVASPAGRQLAKVGSFAHGAIASNGGEDIELLWMVLREAGSRNRGADVACRLADLNPWH